MKSWTHTASPPSNKTRNHPLCHLTPLPPLRPCHFTILPPFLPCYLTIFMHLSHLPSSLLSYFFQLTTLPTTNRSLQNSNVLLLGRQGKHVWLIIRWETCWWDALLALWDLAKAINITRRKISYSLIVPQHQPAATNSMPLQSTHTPHLQHLQSDPHLESGRRFVVVLFCVNSLRVKTVGCFRRGDSSLMNSKCDSVCGKGFHHWGYTGECWTPPAS